MPSSDSYLVIGGCGFLGRHIVEQLLERGESQVSVFDIVQRHFDSNVDFYIGDISKAEDVENAIKKSRATTIIHTASPAHGGDAGLYHLVNVIGTQTVLEAARSLGVRKLVYTSSGSVVFDGTTECINADERIPYPAVAHDAYNDTKAKAEKMVLEANGQDGLLTCAIRPAGIFGPGDRQMITGFYNVVKNNQTRFQIGYNDNLSDYTYVGNVAYAHLLAADKLDQTYPHIAFRDPLPSVNLSLGGHRIPTSSARPLGPNTKPSEEDRLAAAKFASDEQDEEDARPVLRNKMDQFSEQANNDALDDEEEDDVSGLAIAGQAFFITNGEPIYFWDFARSIWKQLGHVPPYIIVIPMSIGLIIAGIMEVISKFTGREPGFTQFRVKQACQMRFYDIERARRLLGYEPQVGVEEGMRRWTEWFKGELEKQSATAAGESEKTK